MAEGDGTRPIVQGFLQALQPRRVRGWAWLPAERDEHLLIEVVVDGTVVAQTQAGTRFADLRRNRIGDGDHGFLLDLTSDLPVAEPERIAVIARSACGLARHLPLSAARARADSPDGTQAAAVPPAGAPQALAPAAPRAAPRLVLPPPAAASGTGHRFLAADRSQRPVFVLGSARSGTTAMVHALRATGRYAGFGEGHLLTLFTQLEQTVAAHYARSVRDSAPGMNTLIAHVGAQTVIEALQHGFVEIVRSVFPAGYWLDKTPGPEMIRAAPAMLRLWPEARFVFLRRHPVDNIESRRRKFPTIAFIDHCKLWSDSMMSWLGVRETLGPAAVEVDQAELAAAPEQATATVAALLNLTATEAERMLDSLQTERPQQTGSADQAPPADLAALDWTEVQRQNFWTVCGGAISAFGYEVEPAGSVAEPRNNRRTPATC